MNKKDYSIKQETQIAEFLGWRRVAGSGSRPNAPGDIVSTEWLGECKTHIKSGCTIHFDLKIWSKIVDEASSQFKQPAYFVDDGSQRINRTWVIFNLQDFNPDVMVSVRPDTKSLNFVSSDMVQDMINQLNGSKCSKLVYKFRLGVRFVMMTDLTTFKELI